MNLFQFYIAEETGAALGEIIVALAVLAALAFILLYVAYIMLIILVIFGFYPSFDEGSQVFEAAPAFFE